MAFVPWLIRKQVDIDFWRTPHQSNLEIPIFNYKYWRDLGVSDPGMILFPLD